jgi:hypothetical protein
MFRKFSDKQTVWPILKISRYLQTFLTYGTELRLHLHCARFEEKKKEKKEKKTTCLLFVFTNQKD